MSQAVPRLPQSLTVVSLPLRSIDRGITAYTSAMSKAHRWPRSKGQGLRPAHSSFPSQALYGFWPERGPFHTAATPDGPPMKLGHKYGAFTKQWLWAPDKTSPMYKPTPYRLEDIVQLKATDNVKAQVLYCVIQYLFMQLSPLSPTPPFASLGICPKNLSEA